MSKSIAILQSNYIPWKGYFDIIAAVDEFVLYDEVQYTRRDWRNRNKLVVGGAPRWLTIPLETKGNYHAAISDMVVSDRGWADKHWRTIEGAYAKAPYFKDFGPHLKTLYAAAADLERLSQINTHFLRGMLDYLEMPSIITSSHDIPHTAETPTARLVEICVARGADEYVSGPAAKAYIETDRFDAAGVALRYTQYSGYAEHPQFSDSFEHGVSMLDPMMHLGPAARDLLKARADREALLE